MYGHIDRLGNDDVGSLLERYADRFGHDLDREIIVMRKAEKESVRDTAPVVELISVDDDDSVFGSSPSAAHKERKSRKESENTVDDDDFFTSSDESDGKKNL